MACNGASSVELLKKMDYFVRSDLLIHKKICQKIKMGSENEMSENSFENRSERNSIMPTQFSMKAEPPLNNSSSHPQYMIYLIAALVAFLATSCLVLIVLRIVLASQ